MYRHKKIVFILIIGLVFIPLIVSAAGFGFQRPTGGRIVKMGASAEIACAAQYGPIFIKPVNIAPPGPYFIRSGKSIPRVGGLILANYNTITDVGTCYNPETGVPIPAFEFKPYGASR